MEESRVCQKSRRQSERGERWWSGRHGEKKVRSRRKANIPTKKGPTGAELAAGMTRSRKSGEHT